MPPKGPPRGPFVRPGHGAAAHASDKLARMQDTDAFLTRTIVGAPQSARLGRRAATATATGAAPDLHEHPWIRTLEDAPPAPPEIAAPPRRGPAGWFERHALAVALAGAAALIVGVALTLFGARAWI